MGTSLPTPIGASTQPDPDTPLPPILVVDDEELILAAVRETLRQEQYEVLTTSDPLGAVAELKRQEFSVIITDQRMPGLSGLELLAQARQLQPNATRILITGVLNLDTLVQAINQGEIYRFIVKPWLREEFLASIQNGRQRYELLRQNARLQAETQSMNQQLLELNRSLQEQLQLSREQDRQLTALNQALAEREVLLTELCPGMVLASSVYSSQGLLLLPEGQRLNALHIAKLRHHHRLEPLTTSLTVYG